MPRTLPAFLLAVAAALGGCAPQYSVPAPSQGALAAAQREIATAPPLREHARGPDAQKDMLRRVAARVFAAAQPICRARHARSYWRRVPSWLFWICCGVDWRM